jgi:hypothetical protein
VFLLLCGVFSLSAQETQLVYPDSLTVTEVRITGNRRTRRPIVEREILFVPGRRYAVSDLEPLRAESQRLLQNSTLYLYSSVDLCAAGWDSVSVCVEVREAWYVFPVIIFELADRNFNVWWQDYDASLDRINYGVYFNHFNLTGWNDILRLKYQHGYTRKHELSYEIGQLPGRPNWGAGFQVAYFRNHEVQYGSEEDRQAFFRDDEVWMLRRTLASVWLNWRPMPIWQHHFGLSFRKIAVDGQVEQLNPSYFRAPGEDLRFFTMYWHTRMDRLDVRPYPFRGYSIQAEMVKEGLALSGERERWWVGGQWQYCLPTGPLHGFETIIRGRLHLLRRNMGFFDYRAMGYGDDVLRGYERYVIDGLDFALLRQTWRYTLLNRDLPIWLPRWDWMDKLRLLPIQIYANVYTDHGFVYDPFFREGHRLRNRWLGTAGVGLDLRLYFDKIFSVMWSFNQLGENGLFLQTKIGLR